MRHASMFLLLAAVGQTACCSSVAVKDRAAEPAAEKAKFRANEPALPEDVACLERPMTRYWYVSSKFRDPKHPFVPGEHSGIDFPAPVGTRVLAPAGGKVARIEPVEPGKDAFVSVRFADGWTYAVHHLSEVVAEKDQEVERGDLLGLSGGAVGADGSGPWTTGPHLHFSVAYEGAFVNPNPYLCPEP